VEEVGEGSATQVQGDQKLDAILLSVTASNVSSKNVYFLSNYWDAWGGKVGTRSSNANDNSWMREINQFQSVQNISGQLHYATSGKYYKLPPFERVAWGNLFPPSYFLYPKETVSTSVLFYVPQGTFDLVHVEIHIPTTEIPKMVDVLFVIDASKVTPKFFRIQPTEGARRFRSHRRLARYLYRRHNPDGSYPSGATIRDLNSLDQEHLLARPAR
jgi:hypothetical protein